LLFQYPEAMFCVVRMLCNRLLRYTEMMQLYAKQNLPVRLASYLLFLARIYGHDVDGKTVIQAGLNQTDIGQKLMSTRESVNRQMKAFSEQGLIQVQGDKIVILDPQALEKICEST